MAQGGAVVTQERNILRGVLFMKCFIDVSVAIRALVVTFAMVLSSAAAHAHTSAMLAADWKFQLGEAPGNVIAADFDDSAWQAVTVPHTWNRLGEYRLTRTTVTRNQRGVGWYRLHFTAPVAGRDQRHFLQFDAVATLAEVWLNGKKIGTHAGAFSRFRFDVTDVLRPGAVNVLVVKADNSKPAPGASTQDVIPLGGDFFIHGGIYRDVTFITTSAVHVDLLDYGGPGVYARATSVERNAADVDVQARVRNDGRKGRSVNVMTRVIDAEGHTVASHAQQVKVAATATMTASAALKVPSPRLWNGRKDPYLYTIQVELSERGATLDAVTQPLGIRSFAVDANNGFTLNGEPVRLRGVSRHQDRDGKGWALSTADHEQDMALIAEIGANAVRFAHYQHAPEWFELADRYGMLVWAEVPFVNEANFTADEPTPALVANARQQVIELIRQNYNHPSVITWSVGNEIDIGALIKRTRPGKALGLLRNLHALARSEDSTRPTVFADCCENPPLPMPAGSEELAGTTDLIGYNRYFGWYYGKPDGLGAALDTLHQRHPGLPLGVSEYGAGGALTQHTDNPLGGAVNVFGRPHPEEYQSWYHEQSWPEISSRPYVWGSWIWNMFDFASDLREEGDAVDINDKGLISYDRKIKKDAFFYYQAQWSDDPVVHINGARYNERAYPVTDVRIYSNAATVRLKLDATDLGERSCEQRVCVWNEVKLHAGANTLIASADVAGRTVTDTVQWNAPDAALGLRIDAGDIVGHRGPEGGLIGSDNFFNGGDSRLLNGYGMGGFGGREQAPRKTVQGATDAALHEAYRIGSFSYDIPVPEGEWQITLHAFEPNDRLADSRTFNVIVNDRVSVKNWSPGKAAGGAMRAAQTSFKVRARNGRLQLRFEPVGGPAVLSAIMIEPLPAKSR